MMPEKPKQCNIDDFYRLVLNKVSYKHKEIDDALKKVEKLLLNIQDAKTKLAENFTQNFWHFFKHNKKCNKLKTIHNVIDNTCQEIDGPIELYTGLVQIFHQTEAQVNYKSIIELLKECAINFTFIYDKDNSKTEIMDVLRQGWDEPSPSFEKLAAETFGKNSRLLLLLLVDIELDYSIYCRFMATFFAACQQKMPVSQLLKD